MRWCAHILVAAVLTCMGLAIPAFAEGESRWVVEDELRSRLISAVAIAPAEPTGLWLGWEVTLDPGWKTYWRYPGETGRAPKFTLLEGRNLRGFDVHFPAPERFTLGGIDGFGYAGQVVLPISLALRRPGEAVYLKLRADFMACKDVCIPFEAVYELSLPAARMSAAPTPHAERIAAARAQLPDAVGDDGAGLALESVSLSGPAGHRRLIAEVTADSPLFDADFFIEPGMDFMIGPLDRSVLEDGRRIQFSLPIEPMDGDAPPIDQTRMRVTISDGRGHAIERWLDFSATPPEIVARHQN